MVVQSLGAAGQRLSSGDEVLRALLVVDEAPRLGGDQLREAVAIGRGAGIGSVVAVQDFADLDYVAAGTREAVETGANTWVVMRQAASAERIAQAFGSQTTTRRTVQHDRRRLVFHVHGGRVGARGRGVSCLAEPDPTPGNGGGRGLAAPSRRSARADHSGGRRAARGGPIPPDAGPGAPMSVETRAGPSLLKASEVAEMLGVPVSWVYEQSRRGRIPTVTSGSLSTVSPRSDRGMGRSNRA